MANPRDVWERRAEMTLLSMVALDIARAYKQYRKLLEDGVDPNTAFLQAIFGIYYAVPPGPPRPDYISTIDDLYTALQDAQLHFSALAKEAEASLAFLKEGLAQQDREHKSAR